MYYYLDCSRQLHRRDVKSWCIISRRHNPSRPKFHRSTFPSISIILHCPPCLRWHSWPPWCCPRWYPCPTRVPYPSPWWTIASVAMAPCSPRHPLLDGHFERLRTKPASSSTVWFLHLILAQRTKRIDRRRNVKNMIGPNPDNCRGSCSSIVRCVGWMELLRGGFCLERDGVF